MFSVVNYGALKCCSEEPGIWDKAAYLKQYTPWIDVALGAILCVAGILVSYGVIPISGSAWFYAAGSAQIILALFFRSFPTCRLCCRVCRSAKEESRENRISFFEAFGRSFEPLRVEPEEPQPQQQPASQRHNRESAPANPIQPEIVNHVAYGGAATVVHGGDLYVAT